MNITELIRHPERLNRETLYDLRGLIALYPYYQPARLLMLHNLYLLHDPTFDEELRRAAAYITDRRVIFNLVEAGHYKIKKPAAKVAKEGNRTVALIDDSLSSIPNDAVQEEDKGGTKEKRQRRKPTAADATVDYVAYLMSADYDEERAENDSNVTADTDENVVEQTSGVKEMKGQNLIDNFIFNEGGNFTLQDEPEYVPELPEEKNIESQKDEEDEYLTETLAGIYIKQGKYSKALEIIKRLNLNFPKINAYFADQIRILEKLILNEKANQRARGK